MNQKLSRRGIVFGVGASAIGLWGGGEVSSAPTRIASAGPQIFQRAIPKSGEKLGVIGFGTSRVFDVGDDPAARVRCREVAKILFDNGGALIDTAAAYFSAEAVAGSVVRELGRHRAFLATKVLTETSEQAQIQYGRSVERLGPAPIDLLQVHNLVGWRRHLPVLQRLKAHGQIRYIGVTHHTEDALPDLIEIVRTQPIDFVGYQYSLGAREAEKELLPLAADKGVAFIANKPFSRGSLFGAVRGKPLPDWARAAGCDSWAQVFLRFVLSNPAVTCAIPGTGKPVHAQDNVGAALKPPPPAAQGQQMAANWDAGAF